MSAYAVSARGLASRRVPQGVLTPMNTLLFGSGEQGAWYDPSDLSMLFQDTAGTTPVTAVEQAVALILDKSKGLVQDNGTSVMNMLATSESLQSGWVYTGIASVTTTPAAITGTIAAGYKGIGRAVPLVSGTAYQLAIDFKADGYTKVHLTDIGFARMPATSFDLVALTASRAEATITDIGGGWRRCVLPFTALGTGICSLTFAGYPDAGATLTGYGVSYTGDGVSGVLMRRPDLRLASNAAVEPLYQRTDAFMGLSVLYAGNHAGQATSTKRPKYSRRVNLLMKTEDFSDAAAWSKAAGGTGTLPVVTANAALAPDGTMTACQIVFDQGAGTTASDRSLISQAIAPQAVNYDGGLWLRTGSGTATLVFRHASASAFLSITVTTTWTYFSRRELGLVGAVTFQFGKYSTQATGSSTVLAWGASLTLATDAHLPYQRVNTATDYDADPNKFPAYLACDGIDDAMVTGNIDFTGTDKMTVWAGVTKLSDAGTQMVAELSQTVNSFTGFYLTAPRSDGGKSIAFRQSGTLPGGSVDYTNATPPFSAVVSAGGDISAGTIFINVNGVHQTAAGNQGTGNHGNYPLYIGARSGTSLYFNGRLYSLIVRGAATPLPQIEVVETLIRQKMRLP